MKHDLDEWITEAIMSETPVIIVEGHDDIQIYEKIAERMNKNFWVEAVENINGYAEGCDAVINCIKDLQPKVLEREENKKYILGIIDRDSREYREEIPVVDSLFVLKYYSFESHFVTRNNLKNLLVEMTFSTKKLIDDKTLNYIESEFKREGEQNLYYISLEALKSACISSYVSEVNYAEEPGKLFSSDYQAILLPKIYAKKDELDAFAREKGIEIKDLKKIVKGKWLLHSYCNYIWEKIRYMKDDCTSGLINVCNYCKNDNTDKCLWKPKYSIQIGPLKIKMLNFFDLEELYYIVTRLAALA